MATTATAAAKEAPQDHMFDTHIDVEKDVREQLIKLCNQQLADNTTLYAQVKQAHWNVKGIHFFQLHELFDHVAEVVQPYSDMIAERATILGGYAQGTVRMAADATTLPDYPTDATAGHEHLEAVIERVAQYAKSTRDAIDKSDELGDPTTADMFTEVSRGVDKQLYFLESHLQAGGVKAQ